MITFCSELGEFEIMENLTNEQRLELKTILFKSGLELMDNKKVMSIERIKNVSVEMVHYASEIIKTNFWII